MRKRATLLTVKPVETHHWICCIGPHEKVVAHHPEKNDILDIARMIAQQHAPSRLLVRGESGTIETREKIMQK